MSWSGAARSGAVDNHDVVTVVDDILKRFLGATPKPRRRLVAAARTVAHERLHPQHADFSTPPRKNDVSAPRASSSPPPAPDADPLHLDVDA